MAEQTGSFLVPLAPPSKKSSNSNDKPKKEVPEYSEPDWGGFRSLPTPFKFEVLKSGSIIEEQLVFDNYKEQSFVLVGRLPTCDLSLNHESVSRNHAVLQQRASDGALFVYDLGSTHGTFINKTKIKPKQYYPLKGGDFLKFGNSSRQFILSGGPEVTLSTKQTESQNIIERKTTEEPTKKTTKSQTDDVDEIENENEKAEEEENADLEHVRDNYLDYYLGNAEEDFDDDFYDRTRKGDKSKTKTAETRAVENAATLQVKKKDLEQQIAGFERKLKDLEDSQSASADNADELDAFMSSLNKSVKLEDTKKIEDQLRLANEEHAKICKLLQLVQSGTNNLPEVTPSDTTKKSKERNIETPSKNPKKPKISKPPLPIFPEPPKTNSVVQDTFVPEYDDDYSEVPMQFYQNQ